MKTKNLRIGFYQPQIESEPATTFSTILNRFESDIPADHRRTWERRNDEPVRLQHVERTHSLWIGDMMRIRMHEDLRKGRRDGTVQAIDFDPDEGIGENTAFLYCPEANVLTIQEYRGGVSLGMFANYFRVFGEVQSISFQPLIKPDAILRVEELPTIRAFEIHLAGVDAAIYRSRNAAARSVLDMMASFDAPKAKITLETGVRRGRPDQPSLINVVQAIREYLPRGREPQPEVEKLVVSGLTDGDLRTEAVINLLEDRLVETIEVTLQDGERVTDAKRFHAVLTAWDMHQESILRVYRAARV